MLLFKPCSETFKVCDVCEDLNKELKSLFERDAVSAPPADIKRAKYVLHERNAVAAVTERNGLCYLSLACDGDCLLCADILP
jgi:hypothetical protein